MSSSKDTESPSAPAFDAVQDPLVIAENNRQAFNKYGIYTSPLNLLQLDGLLTQIHAH